MLNWKSWAAALTLATGAFWLTMAKDPPTSVAADPVGLSTIEMTIKSDLPLAEGGNAI